MGETNTFSQKSHGCIIKYCEVSINSRPLSVDNLADPDNVMSISPSNFMTMKPSIVMSPPGNFTNDDIYNRKRIILYMSICIVYSGLDFELP